VIRKITKLLFTAGFSQVVIAAGVLLFLSACTGTKHVPENEKLYTGSNVSVKTRSGEDLKEGKSFEATLESGIRPLPNTVSLKLFRPRLAIYYAIDSVKKQKGLKYWLKYKVGEPPVYLSSVEPQKISDIITNQMQNEGFFDAQVHHSIKNKGKTASVEYVVTTAEPYTIDNVTFPTGGWELYRLVAGAAEGTLLQKGVRYDLDLLKRERIRIDSIMKQQGYFHFSPEYILFKVDSTAGGARKVDIMVDVKLAIPHEATVPYTIQKVYIYPNYSLEKDAVSPAADTLVTDGYYYITPDSMFRPKAILRAIALEPGSRYNRRDHDFTLSRLTELGVFKFVNVQFEELESSADSGKMACHIYLIPTHKRTLRAELQAITKSNNFAGPLLTTSYRDRNIFKGAELFVLGLNGSYEAQFGTKQRAYNAYEAGISTELYFPRFVSPVRIKSESRLYMPRTQLLLGASKVSRMELFSVNSFKFVGGYSWQESPEKRHELNPVSINYLQLTQATSEFQELLSSNLQLQNSYREQFTAGGTYSYIYNTQATGTPRKVDYYFNGNIDLSGNALSLVERVTGQDFNELLGAPYSQFAKIEVDARYYNRPTEHTRIATRLFSGVGIPYGNSIALPFIEQYFSGGPNSIRAFSARSLGPGSFRPHPDSITSFTGRAGDIRLEGSAELRFDIIGFFKGAVFVDAGNIWLMNKDPKVPGGEFKPGKFLNDVAVGAGAGLRIDVSFFVLRFDVATPLKTPYKETVSGNVEEEKKGLGSNLVLNVALGYPF
jgi:outer membrane translocation and assembly module TamA